MRSRTSRGVPEWFGGKDLYMGSPILSPEKFRVLLVTYRDHREGPGGPPSGATSPGGLHGPSVGGDQPQVGWCAPHKGPRRLGFGEGGLPPHLGGQVSPLPPLGRHPRWVWGSRTPWGGNPRGGAPPPSPLYIVEVLRAANT